MNSSAFKNFLQTYSTDYRLSNDSIVFSVLSLFKKTYLFHVEGKVLPQNFIALLQIEDEIFDLDESTFILQTKNMAAIEKLFARSIKAFEITSEINTKTELAENGERAIENKLLSEEEEISKPVYVLNYQSYETKLGHQDAVTDIFSLGLLLASISFGLDFSVKSDLEKFINHRESLHYLNPNLHPTLAHLIYIMTELDRRKRAQDLQEIYIQLENYKTYNPDQVIDLSKFAASKKSNAESPLDFILTRLRTRLFDISRRNKLLYFKASNRFLNLTIASVPQVLNYRQIPTESLFTWNKEIAKKVKNREAISLSQYLQFEDNTYIQGQLDQLRLESNRVNQEYGFSSLRMGIIFLHWYNFKENEHEKITSPLLLLPVKLNKRKGLKDQFLLEITDTELEVNPVLVYYLNDLYNIKLPSYIDLAEQTVEEFIAHFQSQILATKSGIQLSLVEKPRIQLIHAQAKQTLNKFNQRLKHKKDFNTFESVDYSYKKEIFLPLGLQLFNQYVKLNVTQIEQILDDKIKPSTLFFNEGNTTKELYSLQEGGNNSFNWEIDFCHIILGNFNYKKMSLVRDYNAILEDKISNPVVENLFSLSHKPVENKQVQPSSIAHHYHVVPADPTQTGAIEKASTGSSYLIQGPPGTGKSQTITNLIADFIARGKKVLFVCEKRAAIDVVYYRLQQQGLHDLCCLIHDTQTDKKEFILDLKKTYTNWQNQPNHFTTIEQHRTALLHQIAHEIESLQGFHDFMKTHWEDANTSIKELYKVLLKTKTPHEIESSILENIPSYKHWIQYGEKIKIIENVLGKKDNLSSWTDLSLNKIKLESFSSTQSLEEVKSICQNLENWLLTLDETYENEEIPTSFIANWEQQKHFFNELGETYSLAQKKSILLLDKDSSLSISFKNALQELNKLEIELKKIEIENINWKTKLTAKETSTALSQIAQFESSILRFVQPAFWKLKSVLEQAYDFQKHAIKPTYSQVLNDLEKEHQAAKSKTEKQFEITENFHIENLNSFQNDMDVKRKNLSNSFLSFILKNENPDEFIIRFQKLEDTFRKAQSQIFRLFYRPESLSIEDSLILVSEFKENLNQIKTFLPYLIDLSNMPDFVAAEIFSFPYNSVALEHEMAAKSLSNFYKAHKQYFAINGQQILFHLEKIKPLYKQYFDVNAQYILALQHKKFTDLSLWSDRSVKGLSDSEKEKKKTISEAKRILENEFLKSIRFKSIRELATAESSSLVRELKPIWLMSPTSVSDALPLENSFFDAVIYDEASQITLEEGLPALFRAKQAIIVGDEMQMPPTNFFGSISSEKDSIWNDESETEELISLDADSLLTQGARKLPSFQLGWHYRSHSESLISFSNAAFYERSLLTIPDRNNTPILNPEIVVNTAEDASQFHAAFFDRAISYHFLEKGIYANRTNKSEANYIAQLIKQHLTNNFKESIGVVAFSQEQQGEIENALDLLCSQDKGFEEILENEYVRIDGGQFAGLFIKNLENVQGDERDFIIISTCYGYDSNRKMLMNFGPINRRGGEKRLNVIFSRARKHLAVVSSIKYGDIKNEYNEGANYFRKYLQFAELVSAGQTQLAIGILDLLCPVKNSLKSPNNLMIDELATALESKGFFVQKMIGQSYFKCHLGIKLNANDKEFSVGILIDDEAHYLNENILEQYFLRKELMESFGWKIYLLFLKDWQENSSRVLQEINALLNGESIILNTQIELPSIKDLQTVIAEKEQEKIQLESNSIGKLNAHLEATTEAGTKFWEGYVEGNKMIVTFGKLNSKGQKNTKEFATPADAEKEFLKLVELKKKKGYC